jgi:hypothetical protein
LRRAKQRCQEPSQSALFFFNGQRAGAEYWSEEQKQNELGVGQRKKKGGADLPALDSVIASPSGTVIRDGDDGAERQ